MPAGRVLVIGYGNPLRGDDGFGRLAAELVAARGLDGLEVVVVHQLGPELASTLSEAAHAVFLDAAVAGEPGLLRAADVTPRALSPTALTHDFSPGGLLALALTVYGRAPSATLVTAAGRDFAHGAQVSLEVSAAAHRAAAVISGLTESGRLRTETLRAALPPPT